MIDNSVPRFAQLSDPHIGNKNNNLNFSKAIAKVCDLGIDTIVISGDLTENGLLSEYLQLQVIIKEIKNVFVIAGNHDNIANMAKVFSQKQLSNFSLCGFNIQLINSKVEFKVNGHINIKDIDFNTKNSILITHHPIIKMQSSWNDSLSIDNFAEFEQVFAIENIKMICFGHAHEAKDFKINGVDIYSCPSTARSFVKNGIVGFNVYNLQHKITKEAYNI